MVGAIKCRIPVEVTAKRKLPNFSVLLSILFVVWSNSSYAPVGKNTGFYCNDTSIKEAYRGDSISARFLFLTLLGGAAIVVFVTEVLCVQTDTDGRRIRVPHHFGLCLRSFYASFVYVLAVTEILKFSCGELRPHFYQTCQPDFDRMRCSLGLVTNFRCTGSGPKWLVDRDIYKSFPSGHASLSVFTMVFLAIYVSKRPLQTSSFSAAIWRRTVSVVFFAWSLTCCVSRALDHRHFWWDIMAGAFIGSFSGLIMVNSLLSNQALRRPTGKAH